MACRKISRKADRICIGDLKKPIKIINRKIETSEVSHTMDFSDYVSCRARIDTKQGGQFFNQVNTDDAPTHIFYIRYGYTVEMNYTIELNGNYYLVRTVENLNEENRFLKISCTKNGPKTKQANWA